MGRVVLSVFIASLIAFMSGGDNDGEIYEIASEIFSLSVTIDLGFSKEMNPEFATTTTGKYANSLELAPPFIPINLRITSIYDKSNPKIIANLCRSKNRSDRVDSAICNLGTKSVFTNSVMPFHYRNGLPNQGGTLCSRSLKGVKLVS